MRPIVRTSAVIREGVERKLHTAAQLYASVKGEVVVDEAWGEAQRDSLMMWMSSTKPFGASAVAQLWENGRLGLDDPVAKFIPGFERRGKGGVTLRHLLTHTSGIQHADLRIGDWEHCIATLVDAPLEEGAAPGEIARYSAHGNWYLVGEVIQRVSGERFRDYLRSHLFDPLGMDTCSIGLTPEQQGEYTDRLVMPVATGDRPPYPHPFGNPEMLSKVIPGANGVGPARELARFYEALLAGGERDGHRILDPETVELLTAVHREGLLDHAFQYPMVWGLGFLREHPGRRGRMPYGFGRHASVETFGHGGVESSVAFADPAHGLAVALIFNGLPGEREHQRRIDAVLTTLYEELGLG